MRAAWFIAICLTLTLGAADQPSDSGQLARFQEKVRQDLTGIPNYTCLETIERERREPHASAFKRVDTVRLEVSSVSGKELFAWPGARRFEDRELKSLVTSGTIGTGMYAMFAHNLFVERKGLLQYGAEEMLAGRKSVRYDFHLSQQEAGFQVAIGNASAMVAARGSFWYDPGSLDLIRLASISTLPR